MVSLPEKWLSSFFLEATQRGFKRPALQMQLSQLLPVSLRTAVTVDAQTAKPFRPEEPTYQAAVTDSILVAHGGTPAGSLPEVYMQQLTHRRWRMKEETLDLFMLEMANIFALFCEAKAMDDQGREAYEKLCLVPQILRKVPATVRSVCRPHQEYSYAEIRPLLLDKVFELATCGDASIRGAKVTGLEANNHPVTLTSLSLSSSANAGKRTRELNCEFELGPRGCARRACPYEHVLEATRGTGLRHRQELNEFLGLSLDQDSPPAAKRVRRDQRERRRQRTSSSSPSLSPERRRENRRPDRPDRRPDRRQERRLGWVNQQDRRQDQRQSQQDRRPDQRQPRRDDRRPMAPRPTPTTAKIVELKE